MTRRRRRRWLRDETVAPWLAVGVILGLWWAGASVIGEPRHSDPTSATPSPGATSATGATGGGATGADAARATGAAERPGAPAAPVAPDAPVALGLMVPVAGVDRSALRPSFDELRGGSRRHEAIDILAPRGTPVVAAVDGRVVKLFTSAAGGLTVYQFDREERFCYYYAHLDSYAPNLTEGQEVTRGMILGYVGTTGNAPPDTPHLHFAIFKLGPDKRWWEGEAIDPFPLLQ